MEIINFENGTKTKNACVLIDGVEHSVIPAQWEGNTPITPYTLNSMQKNLLTYKYTLSITSDGVAGATITLPCYYKVGQGTLDVYINGERLLLSSDDAGTDGHYVEVGNANSLSNQIKITTDWNVSAGDYFEFIVRGEWTSETEA